MISDLTARIEEDKADSLAVGQKLGVLLIAGGRPQEAIPVLEETLAQAEDSDPLARAFCLLHLGRALVHTRQVDAARQKLIAALAAAEELGVSLWAGDAAIALSVLDRWVMDLDSSLEYRQAALASYQEAGYLKGRPGPAITSGPSMSSAAN